MKGLYAIVLLVISNAFMTMAWYGHLKFKELKWFENLGLISIVFISWGIALFEYFYRVPANRLGYRVYGGPFSLVEKKSFRKVLPWSSSSCLPFCSSKMKPFAGTTW